MLDAEMTKDGGLRVGFKFSNLQKVISTVLIGAAGTCFMWLGNSISELSAAVDRSKANEEISAQNKKLHENAAKVRAVLIANDAALKCAIAVRHDEPCDFKIIDPNE